MPASLTFGLELEFIAVYKADAFTTGLPELTPLYSGEDIGAREAIHHCLERHGILASLSPTYERWYIHEDGVVLSEEERSALPRGYVQQAIEISSRKLSFADEWQNEVDRVLEVLHWISGQTGCHFLTNKSTGLHVHIGDHAGHSLTTAKRIAQIATAHERNLDRIHSGDRIEDIMAAPVQEQEDILPRPMFAGLSFFHASAEDSETKGSILDVMEGIESKRSFAELGDMCRVRYQGRVIDGHTCTLNLDNLYPDPNASRFADPPSGTMEFRQHGGDLDMQEIVFYISLLADLTDFCKDATDARVVALVAQGVNTAFDLRAFLEFIDCEDELVNHFCERQPRDLATASDPLLQPLIDVNDQENAARRSLAATEAAIAKKISTGVYGMFFEAEVSGGIPLGELEYEWMLSCAKQEIVATWTPPPPDLNSQARQETFRKVANIYDSPDSSEDPFGAAVQQQLLLWMTTYGVPE